MTTVYLVWIAPDHQAGAPILYNVYAVKERALAESERMPGAYVQEVPVVAGA